MSGFVDSLDRGVWEPKGGPAVAGMLKLLDDKDDVRLSVIMTRSYSPKEISSNSKIKTKKNIKIKGLSAPISVLSAAVPFFVPKKLAYYWVELVHAAYLLCVVVIKRPDVIYSDRSNWLVAAILARLTCVPVFLRLLGVPPDMWRIDDDGALFHRLMKWGFRAPFAHVLCSQDGSPGAQWMAKYLHPRVKRTILLNGVGDGRWPASSVGTFAYKKQKSVVFVGRIEELKGVDFFIDSLLEVPKERRGIIRPTIVGDGALLDELREKVVAAELESWISFTGALTRSEVNRVLETADIYVSLNRQGHLTNANLEALVHGVPIVIQCIESPVGKRGELDSLLPTEAYVAVGARASSQEFAQHILDLAGDDQRLENMREIIIQIRNKKMESWPDRLEKEFQMLLNLSKCNCR